MIITINEREIYSPSPLTGLHLTLRVVKGFLWFTRQGSAEDKILHAEEKILIPANGKLVLQALDGSATFELLHAREVLCCRRESRLGACA